MINDIASFMTSGNRRRTIFHRCLSTYNRIVRSPQYVPPTDLGTYEEVRQQAENKTDISDHLPSLFTEAVRNSPKTIVELGVRSGESTAVFERVARLSNADLVSVDIQEITFESEYDRWTFVQKDDVEFGEEFSQWAEENEIQSEIDVLFIDTSHLYEHTVMEIKNWFPHLSSDATVLFHDTNLTSIYRRTDGTLHTAWENDRGVIRAIEDHLGCSVDESEQFVTVQSGFVVEHYPHSNGLTVLQKIGERP